MFEIGQVGLASPRRMEAIPTRSERPRSMRSTQAEGVGANTVHAPIASPTRSITGRASRFTRPTSDSSTTRWTGRRSATASSTPSRSGAECELRSPQPGVGDRAPKPHSRGGLRGTWNPESARRPCSRYRCPRGRRVQSEKDGRPLGSRAIAPGAPAVAPCTRRYCPVLVPLA